VQDDESNVQRYWWAGGTALLVIVLAVWAIRWWGTPPAVEYDNLKYIQLLWTAVSSRNTEWVAKVETAVEQRHAAGEMSPSALREFQRIISLTKAGDWDLASRESYEFAQGQLSRNHGPLPEEPHGHDHAHTHGDGSAHKH
jgi:hypothetical protein